MQGREFKEAVFEQFALIARAFSSPKRLEIIDVLAQGERNVDTLARRTGLTLANASRHLQVLKAANLVASRKAGLQVFYRLSDPSVLNGCRVLQSLAEQRSAEVGQLVRDFFSEGDGLEPVTTEELLRRVAQEKVLILDVRPTEEYASGHIEGALSIPLSQLERRLAELPTDKTIVAYCRGPYCILSVQAVGLLRQRGFDALRLEEGFPTWASAGLPVGSGAR